MSKSIARRLWDGTLFSGINFFATTFFNLAINTVCARSLGTEGFGSYGVILDNINFIVAIAAVGCYDTAVNNVARLRASEPKRVANLVLGLLLVVLVTSLAAVLPILLFPESAAEFLVRKRELAGPFRIGSLAIVVVIINMCLSASLQGMEAFRTIMSGTFFVNLLATPIWMFLGLRFGLSGWLMGYVLQNTLLTGIYAWGFIRSCQRENLPIQFTGIKDALLGLRRQGVPLQVQLVSQEVGNWEVRRLMMDLPNGSESLGLIRAGRTLLSFGPLLQKIIGYASLPVITNTMAEGKHEHVERAVRTNLKLLMLPSIAVTMGVFAALPTLLSLWVGPAFSGAWRVSFILGASILIMLMGQICRQPVVAAQINWRTLWIPVGWSIILAGSHAAGLVRLGPEGFGIAYLLAESFYATVFVILAERHLGIKLWDIYIRLLLFLGVSYIPAIASAVFVPGWWSLLVGGIYSGILFLLGILVLFEKAEREAIQRIILEQLPPSLRNRLPINRSADAVNQS